MAETRSEFSKENQNCSTFVSNGVTDSEDEFIKPISLLARYSSVEWDQISPEETGFL